MVRRGIALLFATAARGFYLGGRRRESVVTRRLWTIRWETLDGVRVIKGVSDGELLRSALMKRGVSPHNGNSRLINCRGLGTCGTCAVEITEGSVLPLEKNAREKLRLNFPPHTNSSSLRLACQCRVNGDVAVVKHSGFWGQYDELAEANTAREYFGELEYALDPSSSEIVCGECDGTRTVPCPQCDGRDCSICRGSGMVVCRSCFRGDPWDIEAVRAEAKRRPD